MKSAHPLLVTFSLFAISGCSASNGGPTTLPAGAPSTAAHHRSASLGPVLTTSDRGEIFGFDIDQNGNDGVLSSWTGAKISVQTFNATTGKITKTLGVKKGKSVRNGDDYVTDGIFANDVALIDFQKAGIPGQTPTHDKYRVMNPVTANAFAGSWNPGIKLFNIVQNAENQATTTSVVYGYQRLGSDLPKLVVTDLAQKKSSHVIKLSDAQFALGAAPQLAQDTVNNLAVIAP